MDGTLEEKKEKQKRSIQSNGPDSRLPLETTRHTAKHIKGAYTPRDTFDLNPLSDEANAAATKVPTQVSTGGARTTLFMV